MKTKEMVVGGLLIGVGCVLHALVPPIFFGMKPDFLLTALFLGIILNPNVGNAVTLGLAAGLISAMTTSFPGGQVANVVDKGITAICVFFVIQKIYKGRVSILKAVIIGALGTLFSGCIFLGTAALIVALPQSFLVLMIAVVLPAMGINAVFTAICYNALSLAGKHLEKTAI